MKHRGRHRRRRRGRGTARRPDRDRAGALPPPPPRISAPPRPRRGRRGPGRACRRTSPADTDWPGSRNTWSPARARWTGSPPRWGQSGRWDAGPAGARRPGDRRGGRRLLRPLVIVSVTACRPGRHPRLPLGIPADTATSDRPAAGRGDHLPGRRRRRRPGYRPGRYFAGWSRSTADGYRPCRAGLASGRLRRRGRPRPPRLPLGAASGTGRRRPGLPGPDLRHSPAWSGTRTSCWSPPRPAAPTRSIVMTSTASSAPRSTDPRSAGCPAAVRRRPPPCAVPRSARSHFISGRCAPAGPPRSPGRFRPGPRHGTR